MFSQNWNEFLMKLNVFDSIFVIKLKRLMMNSTAVNPYKLSDYSDIFLPLKASLQSLDPAIFCRY